MPDRLVLGYHGVSDAERSRRTLSRAELRRQLATLLRRGYTGRTFHAVVLGGADGDCFAATFDDGESSVVEHAFEVLGELGVPGTVFAPVSPVGAPGVLGWDDLRQLAGAGWEIGSHTVSHVRLTSLGDAELHAELKGSRTTIEDRLGVPCRSIAYPYDALDARVRAAAAAAGFTAGCTTTASREGDPLAWPRVGVDGADTHLLFRLKTTRSVRAIRATLLRPPFDRVGRAARALAAR